MFIPLILVTLFILALIVEDIKTLLPGYFKIITNNSILVTDYLAVGGLNSTLLNVTTTLGINYILVKIVKLRISGPIFAGMMLLTGYSFFGINTINFIPVYIGIYIYSKIKKIEYRTLIIPVLFSCGISSLISYLFFGLNITLFLSIPIGILVGIILGLIIPAITSHVIIFHSGYNLYNIGFTLGLVSIVIYGVFVAFELNVETVYLVSSKYHTHLLIGLITIALIFLINGIIDYKESFGNYKKLLTRSGRLLQDFIRDYKQGAVSLNIGVNLIFCIILILILNITISGALIASLGAVIGFSAMGKHIKNIYPVILGALLAIFVTKTDLSVVQVQIGIFFVTALSPLSGRYGLIVGIVAGFIHIIITPVVALVQGPFNLYLNGFVAGFVAAILISIIESYEQEFKYDN